MSVFSKNVFDDFRGRSFTRCKEEKVDDSSFTISHRHRFRNIRKASHLLQSLLERISYLLDGIFLLHFAEQALNSSIHGILP